MKTRVSALSVLALLVALTLAAKPLAAAPLGTGFTYQGQLKENGAPIDGPAHLRFSLWDAEGNGAPPVGGSQIGASQLLANVPVANGLFTVLLNAGGQFGADAFNGEARWIQIEVCADAGCGTLTVLSPRQPLTAAPYALQTRGIFVDNAGNVGIGTSTPAARLAVRGDGTDVLLGSAGCGAPTAAIGFGTMSGCTNFALGANVDAGADAGTFLNRPAGRSIHFRENNGSDDQMTIAPGGSVGIGTTTPGAKLDVIAAEPFGIFGRNSATNSVGVFGQSSGSNSTGVLGRYDGPSSNSGWGVFGFSPNGYAGVFGSGGKNGVFGQTSSANDSGVFGKNDGSGVGVFGSGTMGDGVFGTGNKNGVHGRTGSAGDSGVWGENTGTGYGTAGSSVNGVGVIGDSTNGFAMQARGNTVQSLDKGGWVKAMAYIDPLDPGANKIIRCYNSQATGSTVSTPPCGFTYSSGAPGCYDINFGFRVSDRFISVTPACTVCVQRLVVAQVELFGVNTVKVEIRYNDNDDATHSAFFIIVY